MVNCSIDAGIGNIPITYGKGWVVLPNQTGYWIAPNTTDTFSGNTFRTTGNASVLGSDKPYEAIHRRRQNYENGGYCTTVEDNIYKILSQGTTRITLGLGDYIWGPAQDNRGWEYGSVLTDGSEYHQGASVSVGCFLDCHYIYNGSTVYGVPMSAQVGWNRVITQTFSSYGKYTLPYTSFSMWKTFRINVIDTDKNPIQGVKVSFWGSNGTNLTHGVQNTIQAGKYIYALTKQQGINWDAAYLSVLPTDNTQWFKDSGTSHLPPDGSVIWYKSEKIKLVNKRSDTGPAGGVRYDVEKGYDGTVPSYVWLAWYSSYQGMIAPEYHLTDVNGNCYNPTLCWDCQWTKKVYTDPSPIPSTKDLEGWITQGYLNRKKYTDITIKVEKTGYKPFKVVVPESYITSSGNVPINFIIQLSNNNAENMYAIKIDDNIFYQIGHSSNQIVVLDDRTAI